MTIRDKLVLQGPAKAIKEASDLELALILKDSEEYDPLIVDMSREETVKRFSLRIPAKESEPKRSNASISNLYVDEKQTNNRTSGYCALSWKHKLFIILTCLTGIYFVPKLFDRSDTSSLKEISKATPIEAEKASQQNRPKQAANNSGNEGRSGLPRQTSIKRGSWMYVKHDGFFGFEHKEDLELIKEYIFSEDQDAYKTALGITMMNGTCEYFRKGDEVYVEERELFNSQVKIRKRESLTSYWAIENLLLDK